MTKPINSIESIILLEIGKKEKIYLKNSFVKFYKNSIYLFKIKTKK